METYFLDTYALFELFKGNANYRKFEKGIAVITTQLNLMEFYYILLRIKAENPDFYYDRLVKFVVKVSDELIKKATRFRFENKTRGLSYVDAIGYTLAMEKNVRFVTGDRQFEKMEGVEFVK